jgi:hypothetical protein
MIDAIGFASFMVFLGVFGHKSAASTFNRQISTGETCMTTPANPGTTAPVTVSPKPTLVQTVESDVLTGLTSAAELAPGAISAASAAQTAVAAQSSVLGKAETAAGAAFSFALPIISAIDPALGTSISGIVAELVNIETAFGNLMGHVKAVGSSTTATSSSSAA